MPRHRIPSSTQTQLTAAPPAAKIARPSDLEDSGLLEVDDQDVDDDMPMTVAPAATTPTDFELLERWRGGDLDAGNVLFERHFAGVYRFFARKTTGDAADLVQKTFLACTEGRDALPSP